VAGVALAASQLETLRRIVLPTNQSALRIAAAAFGRGQVNIFQVLQVQRTYADATTALLDASRRYATSLADLEAAVGAPVQ
jgi:outer membrane protein TolC